MPYGFASFDSLDDRGVAQISCWGVNDMFVAALPCNSCMDVGTLPADRDTNQSLGAPRGMQSMATWLLFVGYDDSRYKCFSKKFGY